MEERSPSATQVKKKRVKKKVLKKRVKPENDGENGGELLVEPKSKGDEVQASGSRRGSFSQEKTDSKVPDKNFLNS